MGGGDGGGGDGGAMGSGGLGGGGVGGVLGGGGSGVGGGDAAARRLVRAACRTAPRSLIRHLKAVDVAVQAEADLLKGRRRLESDRT